MWSSKSEMARWCSIDGGLQIRMHGNVEVDRISMFVFCLAISKAATPQMLRTEPDSIFAPAGCVR